MLVLMVLVLVLLVPLVLLLVLPLLLLPLPALCHMCCRECMAGHNFVCARAAQVENQTAERGLRRDACCGGYFPLHIGKYLPAVPSYLIQNNTDTQRSQSLAGTQTL